jgi:type I restriction enzyme M protein
VVRTPERDVLFLERAVDLLRPGGRLGIVLPYNKAAGEAFAALRRWLVGRMRLFAVVGLPRETFMPYTSQRTFVLFAKRRAARVMPDDRERVLFAVSERAGKDAAGDPIPRRGGREGALDHDLDDVLGELVPFLEAEGFAS